MTLDRIAILSPGAMGAGVGRALAERGHDVLTCLDGRSAATRARARAAGFREAADLRTVAGEADLILSILPPEAALETARAAADAMREAGRAPPYADCNAVAPATARRIGEIAAAAGADFIDCGIVGWPPAAGAKATRFFVSGPSAGLLAALDGKGIDVRQSGAEIGRASAIKMCYASVSKGANALHAAAMTAAEALGVGADVRAEIGDSAPGVYERMRETIPRLPADAGRWAFEMEEIARTFESAGLAGGFHRAAADTFRLLDASPLGAESRETMDRSRTMEETVAVFVRQLACAQAEDRP